MARSSGSAISSPTLVRSPTGGYCLDAVANSGRHGGRPILVDPGSSIAPGSSHPAPSRSKPIRTDHALRDQLSSPDLYAALRRHAVFIARHKYIDPDELVQNLYCWALEGNTLERYDPARASLKTWLAGCMRFILRRMRAQRAKVYRHVKVEIPLDDAAMLPTNRASGGEPAWVRVQDERLYVRPTQEVTVLAKEVVKAACALSADKREILFSAARDGCHRKLAERHQERVARQALLRLVGEAAA